MSAAPDAACRRCLCRGRLLASLAGHIERAVRGRRAHGGTDLLALGDAELAAAVGAPGRHRDVPSGAAAGGEARRLLTTCRHRPAYPAPLAHLGDAAPFALWLRGSSALFEPIVEGVAVTIVGSRRATPYGREVAYELGRLLAGAGLVVVSGLAHGVDAAAHRGALDAGGPTVAVLGSGADVAYPAGQAALYRRISREGLVVSEMPPGFQPLKWSFPARNRIMAALGAATVVVEAAQRSGSLITVRVAQGLGREVGAVPGPINSRFSRASNALIADGAFPVLGAESVLEQILGPGASLSASRSREVDPELAPLLERIEAGDSTPDAIAAAAGLSAGHVAGGLARLELLGEVRVDAAGRYVACRIDSPEGGGH